MNLSSIQGVFTTIGPILGIASVLTLAYGHPKKAVKTVIVVAAALQFLAQYAPAQSA